MIDGDDLVGAWKFDHLRGQSALDLTGNGRHLRPTGQLTCVDDGKFGCVARLDGDTQWLGTDECVLQTDESYSIAAWVRIDSEALKGELKLEPEEYAWTAVSQDSETHSPFYLGIRGHLEELADGSMGLVLRWNITISPVDGSVEGVLEWQHAFSSRSLDESVFDQWILLVGVCDKERKRAHLYVPHNKDKGSTTLIEDWPFWHAPGGLQVGRAIWLGRHVDQWPGSIGPVSVYAGVLTQDDAARLYKEFT